MNDRGRGMEERGLGLAAASWRVLRADKSPGLVAAFSAFCTAFALLAFVVPTEFALTSRMPHGGQATCGAAPTPQATPAEYQIDCLAVFLLYVVMPVFATSFNTALAGAALSRLRGEAGGAMVGFRVALANLPAILVYALIPATVGMLLRFGSRWFGFLAGFGIRLVGGAAWAILSCLVVPVIAAERRNPLDAIRPSAALLRGSWGDRWWATWRPSPIASA